MSLVSDVAPARTSICVPTATHWWRGWFGVFQRTTSSGRLIPAIDGLRSLAIIAVIMHHLGGYVALRTPGIELHEVRQEFVYRMTNVGNYGVQLFFVISGFILAVPFAEQFLRGARPVSIGRYFRRRIARLHPPYLINLVLIALLFWAFKQQPWSELGPHLLASSLYLHNIVYQSMSTVNGVAWSLEVEVQFYLLAPLLAQVFRIQNSLLRRSLLSIAIAFVILLKWMSTSRIPFSLSASVLHYLDFFLGGLLLADWYVLSSSRPERRSLAGAAWDVIGLISLPGCLFVMLHDSFGPLLPLLLIATCAAALRGPRLNWLFSLPVLVAIGGMCYTTYLYHFFVISLVSRHVTTWTAGRSFPVALTIETAITLPVILCVSAALHLSIEKPFMQRREA